MENVYRANKMEHFLETKHATTHYHFPQVVNSTIHKATTTVSYAQPLINTFF